MSLRTKIVLLLLLVAAVVVGAIVNRSNGEGPASPTVAGEDVADRCTREQLDLVEPDVLTVGAAGPSDLPWLAQGDPAPQGFEPAVAAAVAEFMHFGPSELRWVEVARDDVLAAGPQDVDFALGQLVPAPELDELMDFTEPYYDVEQAVLVRESSALADGATLGDLRQTLIGAPSGPSRETVLTGIQPAGESAVFGNAEETLAALRAGDVDAAVIDYPTALDLLRSDAAGVVAVGRLPAQGDLGWGFATSEGSPLRPCLAAAIANVRQQGFDRELAQAWIEPEAPPLLVDRPAPR